ncbi:MAG: helix-turn-helix domain-containing protein [Flexilinea sp.]|nr:helix-turn-helix domain-containing protein [Flexilinea sp.]
MFKDNLVQLRKLKSMTQEDIAEKVGVSRQTVAKWESGESTPDLEKSRMLAEALDVSLDNLANYEPTAGMNLGIPPKGKHIFGIATIGDKGQIVIPAKARKIFHLSPGDQLCVLGDESQGIALIKSDYLLAIADAIQQNS